MATENQKQGDHKKNGHKPNIVQRIIQRKLNFFAHICRISDDRLIKHVVFGIIDGKNKRGRPKRRWTDDLVDWCNKDIGSLYRLVMDRMKWTHFMKFVMDTNYYGQLFTMKVYYMKVVYKMRVFFCCW